MLFAFTASKFFPRLCYFLIEMSQNVHTMFVVLSLLRLLLLLLLLLQSNIITLPLLESDWQSCVLRAPCPSNLNPNPKCCSAACQALSLSLFLSDLSQFVSLSASLEGEQGEAGGGQLFTCLCFCYSFILICLPLRFIFLRFFLTPLCHPSPFSIQLYLTSLALSIWKIVKSARRAIKLSSDLLTHFSLTLSDAALSIPSFLTSRTALLIPALSVCFCATTKLKCFTNPDK